MISKLLKIICVAVNWWFAIMMGLSSCVEQNIPMLIAAQLWIFAIIMVFPLFKKRRDLNES